MRSLKAKGKVFEKYGNPPGQSVMVDFPRIIQELKNVYDLKDLDNNSIIQRNYKIPDLFPVDWVLDETTIGSNCYAHLEDSGPPAKGSRQNDVIDFDSAD